MADSSDDTNERIDYSEKRKAGRPGPKPRPDLKLHFKTVGMTLREWQYLRLYFDDAEDCEEDQVLKFNPSHALPRLIEDTRSMHPFGPQRTRPRDGRGRFIRADGTNRRRAPHAQLLRRIHQLEEELRQRNTNDITV